MRYDSSSGVPRTLFDKLWDSHVVEQSSDGWYLMHVDRLLLHDLTAAHAFDQLEERSLLPANPELVFATPDHAVSSRPGRTGDTSAVGRRLYAGLKAGARSAGVTVFDLGSGDQGIVNVIGPELGIALPGLSIACGDSHTCTHGALGVLAIGIGSSEGVHALATQTLRLQKPKKMRVVLSGRPEAGVSAKDIALHVVNTCGISSGIGHAVEYAGVVVEEMEIEERLTLCNMAIEMGARFGVVAPDDKTVAYVRGRVYAPQGEAFDQAVSAWNELRTDDDATFDKEIMVDVTGVEPVITWGVNPEQSIPISGHLPRLEAFADEAGRTAAQDAFAYMGLQPGDPIAGTPIDRVFIGSCNSGRLADLHAAAAVVRGRTVAAGVSAWVVPGSERVKHEAELAGLDLVFKQAGFEWREPGCSLCAASMETR